MISITFWRSHTSRPDQQRRAFTLVEMLVAMAITLLMMAALARAFGFVGARVRESRADTELASKLRDMTTRLSDELKQCTVNLAPNDGEKDQLGYFVYYEGPLTGATSSLFRAVNDSAGNVVLSDSKYGDLDDYIAFTAVAQGNNWFTGNVPRYILDMKSAEIAGTTYSLPGPPHSAFEPVVIRSKYAEIVYFASPEYNVPPLGVASSAGTLPANTAYIDADGDLDLGSGSSIENGIPDRIRIHRRVLLIRPDLNTSGGLLPIQIFDDGLSPTTIPFMQADAGTTLATWPDATATTVTTSADTSLGWLYGMAGVHQQCDLSVRRVLNASGLPTAHVAANSLADLSQPQNRFAHVRVPVNELIGSGSATTPTSMPVLALGDPATIFSTNTSVMPARIAPPATPSTGPVVTPNSLSGFIRPEFVLGYDYTHHNSTADSWGLERVGEDLLTNNVLGFDVQVFDPDASFFVMPDVSDPTIDRIVVGPSDAGYREAIHDAITDLGLATPIMKREQGGFVDLAYPVLAGGSLRGWQPRRLDRRSSTNDPLIATTGAFLITPFSGVANYTSPPSTPAGVFDNAYQASLYKSGKLVTTGGSIRLFQPTFDTFTSFFERDGFRQDAVANPGTLWFTTTVATATAGVIVDAAADGLDNDTAFGPDDSGERETLPPFRARPEAIRVTIRIENPSTRQIRQASVVHRDEL